MRCKCSAHLKPTKKRMKPSAVSTSSRMPTRLTTPAHGKSIVLAFVNAHRHCMLHPNGVDLLCPPSWLLQAQTNMQSDNTPQAGPPATDVSRPFISVPSRSETSVPKDMRCAAAAAVAAERGSSAASSPCFCPLLRLILAANFRSWMIT